MSSSEDKTEKKENKPIYNCIKRIKYLGINLNKEVKDLYMKNYNTVMKEIKEDTKNEKIFCAHGLEKSILLSVHYYSKEYTDSMQSLSNSMATFKEIE